MNECSRGPRMRITFTERKSRSFLTFFPTGEECAFACRVSRLCFSRTQAQNRHEHGAQARRRATASAGKADSLRRTEPERKTKADRMREAGSKTIKTLWGIASETPYGLEGPNGS